MKISDLNPEYDKLQQEYGAKELSSIYNGGCTNNPDICFVFMNPTGRKIGLLNENIYEEIQRRKAQEWLEME